MDKENKLIMEMIKYYSGDAKRIQHFTKVHEYAVLIGQLEKLDNSTLEIIKASSIVHDIGIKKAEELYGRCDGKLQEKLGPDIASSMMKKIGYDDKLIDRVCYLIAHHHTYNNIDSIDYQILVEADFLVNMYEDNLDIDSIRHSYKKIFKTTSGKIICKNMYDIN